MDHSNVGSRFDVLSHALHILACPGAHFVQKAWRNWQRLFLCIRAELGPPLSNHIEFLGQLYQGCNCTRDQPALFLNQRPNCNWVQQYLVLQLLGFPERPAVDLALWADRTVATAWILKQEQDSNLTVLIWYVLLGEFSTFLHIWWTSWCIFVCYLVNIIF